MSLPGQVLIDDAISTRNVSFDSDGAAIRANLAVPRHAASAPGVVLLHEAFGLNEHIRDVARRLANRGFSVLAPDLYSRGGAPRPDEIQDVLRAVCALPDAQIVRDIESAAGYLRGLDTATGRVGCIGFCSGGRQTLLAACASTVLDAAIDCWGGYITRATPSELSTQERPVPVIDLAESLHCPLFVVVGAEDRNPSPEDAGELMKRVERTGQPTTIRVFEDAGHAFFADYRPTYREGPAFELWPLIVSFFETHLRGSPELD